MKPIPRILPLIGVAAGGVLAINALAGARQLPDLISGAKAFAEGAKHDKQGKDATAGNAATGDATDASAKGVPALASAAKPQPVCAPTAAELAKEAGLSPAELQVLQSLGERRGQLDQRESDLNTQLALMAAAEAKLDAKVHTLNGLKAEIQGLLTQTDQKQASEVDRLVKVFEGMKPKDAAPRMVVLDDSVRLPIAARMKERSLSAILALMPPAEAKRLTESLANRFSNAKSMAANAAAAANQAASQVATPAPAAAAANPAQAAPASEDPVAKAADAKPARRKAPAKQPKKAPPRKSAPATAEAAAAPAAKSAPQSPAAASPAAAKAG